MGMSWKVMIKDDNSVTFTVPDNPSIGVTVTFSSPNRLDEPLGLVQGQHEMIVFGKLKLRSIGNGGNSYNIPTGGGDA